MEKSATQSQWQELTQSIIQRLAVGPNRGRDIDRDEAKQIMGAILNGLIDPVQAAVILIALRMKGEAECELLGLLDALQSKLSIREVKQDELFQLVDPFDGYTRSMPVTPFVPSVLAACGLSCYSIGLESVGPKYGVTTHQILLAAGATARQNASHVVAGIEKVGWGYLDQSVFAPELAHLKGLRDQVVKRTAITTIERTMRPLSGSSKTHLVIGYVHKPYLETYAMLARENGFSSSLLVKGVEGGFAPALNKPLRTQFCDHSVSIIKNFSKMELPSTLASPIAAIHMSDSITDTPLERAAACLRAGYDALEGNQGVFRQSLIVACLPVLINYGYAKSFGDAVEIVENCLDNGLAHSKFNQLVEFYS